MKDSPSAGGPFAFAGSCSCLNLNLNGYYNKWVGTWLTYVRYLDEKSSKKYQ